MEADINQPKSKAFNIFLRMFQLSLQLILGYWASKFQDTSGCVYHVSDLISYIAYGLAGINLIALIAMRCMMKFSRPLFFIVFFIDFLIAVGIIVIQALIGHSQCAASNVYQLFSIIQSSNAIVISIVTLIMRLAWAQRYTNAPGNIAWPLLFLLYQWSSQFNIYMLIIGIGTAAICIITLLLHLSTFIKTSIFTKKMITMSWVIGIILLLVFQALALIAYFTTGNPTQYIDAYAKRTLAIFIAVNVIDILFWLWGLKTLDYEKGDQVRENLFSGKDNQNGLRITNDQSIVVTQNIGTVH